MLIHGFGVRTFQLSHAETIEDLTMPAKSHEQRRAAFQGGGGVLCLIAMHASAVTLTLHPASISLSLSLALSMILRTLSMYSSFGL